MLNLHDLIIETLNIFESEDIKQLEKEKMRLYMKVKNWKKSGKDTSELEKQLNDAKKRLSDAKKSARLATKGAVVTPQQATPTGDDSLSGDLGTTGFGSLDIDSMMNGDEILVKNCIEEFLIENYHIKSSDIGKYVEIHRVGKYYIINAPEKSIYVANKSIDALTNGFFKWGHTGNFVCNNCENLTSLEGAPVECKSFACIDCKKLTSLEGVPAKCSSFDCSKCKKLTSLEGAPKKCEYFFCSKCKNLTSLKGAPRECHGFGCDNCENLTSLKGAPRECHGFNCDNCKNLTSLEGAPEKCEYFSCNKCASLKSLKYAPQTCVNFSCKSTGIVDLKGLQDAEVLTCSKCDNLISLKGCPKKLKYLYALQCGNLTDVSDLPIDAKMNK